ncbi:hypothetical protein R3P38DRAFT_2770941 [Favolaschia claudopus]|uniref:Uncharacterized protein n=1 Tax=Favolaschia claudopus TaxID=2862362 RepID=A0AAW0CCK9_9AGAR
MNPPDPHPSVLRPKRGRPKGSKDGPRAEGAPPRGRPRTRNKADSDSEDGSEKQPPKKRPKTSDNRKHTLPIPARQNPWILPSAATTATVGRSLAEEEDEYDQYFDTDQFTTS